MNSDTGGGTEFKEYVDNFLRSHDSKCDICDENMPSVLSREITKDEIIKVIKDLPNGKAG